VLCVLVFSCVRYIRFTNSKAVLCVLVFSCVRYNFEFKS